MEPGINQFGGLPGSGINHYLALSWNNILEALEHDENSAISMVSVDFAKAFNTMGHGSCLKAFKSKGASDHSVAMIAAFLRNRRMKFKVGETMSDERLVKGGSPQGTLLGNILFIITTDDLELGPDTLRNEISVPELSFEDAEEYNGSVTGGGIYNDSDNMDPSTIIYMEEQSLSNTNNQSNDMGTSTGTIDSELNNTTARQITFAEAGSPPKNWKDQPLAVYKYVDDFIGIEKVCTNKGQMHCTQNKTQITVRASKSEEFYLSLIHI